MQSHFVREVEARDLTRPRDEVNGPACARHRLEQRRPVPAEVPAHRHHRVKIARRPPLDVLEIDAERDDVNGVLS